jgi:hypothetical protein
MILSKDSRKAVVMCLIAFASLGLSLLISAPVWAQVVGATLSGTVIDTSRAIVPQAQISIRNVETAISRDIGVNSGGFYTAPNLLPGAYEISASAPGFTTEFRRITSVVSEDN